MKELLDAMPETGSRDGVCLVSGEYAYVRPDGTIATNLVPRLRIENPGFRIHYLDLTIEGVPRIAGQAQVDPPHPDLGTWEWDRATGRWNKVSSESPGTWPVIYSRAGRLHIATLDYNGSQGWRYINEYDGQPIRGDDTMNKDYPIGQQYGIPDLWEYSFLGGRFIGQGHTGIDVLIKLHPEGPWIRKALTTGNHTFVRVKYDRTSDRYAIALVDNDHQVVRMGWPTGTELDSLPDRSLVPVQPPPPIVIPEEPKMPEPIPFPSELLAQFATRFPLPQGEPGEAHENKCRQWCLKLAEQFRFTFLLQQTPWGVKKAAGPQSKDTIAQQLDDTYFLVYDLMTGAGTGRPTLNLKPHPEKVGPGQTFIPVSPVNHLGAAPSPGQPLGPIDINQKHPWWRGDNEPRTDCNRELIGGGQCDRPPDAPIHDVTEEQKPPSGGPLQNQIDDLRARVEWLERNRTVTLRFDDPR